MHMQQNLILIKFPIQLPPTLFLMGFIGERFKKNFGAQALLELGIIEIVSLSKYNSVRSGLRDK